MIIKEFRNIVIGIENSWSDDYSMGIAGFIFGKNERLKNVHLCIGKNMVEIKSWHNRPDVVKNFRHYRGVSEKCGFFAQISKRASHKVEFIAEGAISLIVHREEIAFDGHNHIVPDLFVNLPDGLSLFADFARMVNENNLSVLEIGSRIVGDASHSLRNILHGAKIYKGFDLYKDENTDIVGEVHQLSKYLKGETFDAIFSMVVFEHLAMPWVVALEINKCLNIHGITYHQTHFSWPLHEIPWDFWRFSHYGLKVLFSPPLGFEIIGAGVSQPASIHLQDTVSDQEYLPFLTGYAASAILARKNSQVDPDRFKWDISLEDLLSKDSMYPIK